MKRSTWIVLPFGAMVIAAAVVMRPESPSNRPATAVTESRGAVFDPANVAPDDTARKADQQEETRDAPARDRSDAERLADVYALFAANTNDAESDAWADVPDLRYYLNPHVIASMRDLSQDELLRRVNEEKSPEAAYGLAMRYHAEQESYVMLMLVAAGYAQKPGPLLDAMNGCCGYAPGDSEAQRAATIKLEALRLLARQLHLPEAASWPGIPLDPDIAEAVRAQRAVYVDELNRSAMAANGERWVK